MAHLLVIEDNEPLRSLMALALRLESFTVDTAATLDAGLELLARQRIDLVLTDLFGRPASGALERLRLLHEAAPAIPVVLVTGYTVPRGTCLADYGISGLIYKPFDFETLVVAIRLHIVRPAPRLVRAERCRMRQRAAASARLSPVASAPRSSVRLFPLPSPSEGWQAPS